MKLVMTVALLLAVAVCPSWADDKVPEPFSGYVPFELGDNLLYLDPELAHNARIKQEFLQGVKAISLITIPLRGHSLSISYDPGLSDDPSFAIHFPGDFEPEHTEYLLGEQLYIAQNGSFYLVSRTNQSFEKRLMFRLTEHEFQEVEQPFYLIDQVSKTTAPLTIYSDKCNLGKPIASLPEGSSIKILLKETAEEGCPAELYPASYGHGFTGNYLVQTTFGLVGWATSVEGDLNRPGKPLESIRFYGD